mgnify:CR=1 FL=1
MMQPSMQVAGQVMRPDHPTGAIDDLGPRLHPELVRDHPEPGLEQHPELAPRQMPAEAAVDPADQREVPVALAGAAGCTHLNDALRSLADVPQLVAALDAQAVAAA